jgi:hypothetical protein
MFHVKIELAIIRTGKISHVMGKFHIFPKNALKKEMGKEKGNGKGNGKWKWERKWEMGKGNVNAKNDISHFLSHFTYGKS